jgi:hypothetical protein
MNLFVEMHPVSDKFLQRIGAIRVVKRSGSGTLLPDRVIEAAAKRIAAGEDADKVATELAMMEVELLDED